MDAGMKKESKLSPSRKRARLREHLSEALADAGVWHEFDAGYGQGYAAACIREEIDRILWQVTMDLFKARARPLTSTEAHICCMINRRIRQTMVAVETDTADDDVRVRCRAEPGWRIVLEMETVRAGVFRS